MSSQILAVWTWFFQDYRIPALVQVVNLLLSLPAFAFVSDDNGTSDSVKPQRKGHKAGLPDSQIFFYIPHGI